VALIMLGVVLLVQQVEGHVLQPFIMGTAVRVHPLAVVMAVAGGSMVAGIAGAFFAVPVVATLNVMVNYIASGTWRTDAVAVPATPSGAAPPATPDALTPDAAAPAAASAPTSDAAPPAAAPLPSSEEPHADH
jgi:hypothetical protein